MSAGADAHDDDHGHEDDHGHGDDHATGGDTWVLIPLAVGLVIGLIIAVALGLGSDVVELL